MINVIKPYLEIIIDGKNVSGEITPFLSKVEYTDRLEEACDDISLTFDNVTGLWSSSWYPQQGDTLTVNMGYPDNVLKCGLFEIDEIEFSGPPDTFVVKGISAGINKKLRTRNNRAYEKQTLRDIAQAIATKHSLSIIGKTSQLQKIQIERKTQENETDLSFLSKLSAEYGIIFSLRGDKLIFTDFEEMYALGSIATLNKLGVSSYRFKDKTSDTFQSASISKRNTKNNKLPKWRIEDSGDPTKKDTLIINANAGNDSQAEALAKGGLKNQNKDKYSAYLSLGGNPLFVAGANLDLNGFDTFSGKWQIKESRHSIEANSTYSTSVDLRKEDSRRRIKNPKRDTSKNWDKLLGI